MKRAAVHAHVMDSDMVFWVIRIVPLLTSSGAVGALENVSSQSSWHPVAAIIAIAATNIYFKYLIIRIIF